MSYCRDFGEEKTYFFSVYGLAVKHGFSGTEEQFLESLNGKELQLSYDSEQQALMMKHDGDTDWTVLISLPDLQGSLIEDTLSQAENARDESVSAKDASQLAAQQSLEYYNDLVSKNIISPDPPPDSLPDGTIYWQIEDNGTVIV